jgi:hypothetical protein
MKKIMFLMMLVVLLAVPMVSYAESAQESELVASSENLIFLASFNCGTGTCKDGESCCSSYNICCPSGKNIYCSSSNTCYSTVDGAKADCGENYYVCASPAEGKRQEFIVEPVSKDVKECEAWCVERCSKTYSDDQFSGCMKVCMDECGRDPNLPPKPQYKAIEADYVVPPVRCTDENP